MVVAGLSGNKFTIGRYLSSIPYESARLRYEYFQPQLSATAGRFNLSDTQLADGTCCSVVGLYLRDRSLFKGNLIGTAFFVAPGIAITAGHVSSHLVGADGSPQRPPDQFHLDQYFRRPPESAQNTLHWIIRQLSVPSNFDLSILTCEYASGPFSAPLPLNPSPVRLLKLSSKLPKEGDVLLHYGIRHVNYDISRGGLTQHVTPVALGSLGEVIDVKPHGMTSMKGPVIVTGCFCESGMSGGPVFNKDGEVVGIISTSMKGATDADHFTRVSSIISVFDWNITPKWQFGEQKEAIKLRHHKSVLIA